jgi:hypothetical protein
MSKAFPKWQEKVVFSDLQNQTVLALQREAGLIVHLADPYRHAKEIRVW